MAVQMTSRNLGCLSGHLTVLVTVASDSCKNSLLYFSVRAYPCPVQTLPGCEERESVLERLHVHVGKHAFACIVTEVFSHKIFLIERYLSFIVSLLYIVCTVFINIFFTFAAKLIFQSRKSRNIWHRVENQAM